MKHSSIEHDVDFIGGQDPMTKEEEKEISEFIKARKLLNYNKLKENKSHATKKG